MLQVIAQARSGKDNEILNEIRKKPSSTIKMVNIYKIEQLFCTASKEYGELFHDWGCPYVHLLKVVKIQPTSEMNGIFYDECNKLLIPRYVFSTGPTPGFTLTQRHWMDA